MSNFTITYSLCRSEIKLQIRSIIFYVLCLLALVFGIFIVQNLMIEKDIMPWGPYYLTKTLITVSFIFPLIQSPFIIKASIRDCQFTMEELVYSTAITKSQYLVSRYIGVIMPSILLYVVFLIGVSLGLIHLSHQNHLSIDTFLFLSTLAWASIVFLCPAFLLSSMVLFSVGLFSRSAFIVYLAAGLSFFLYQLLSVITGSPNMAQPFVLNETLKFAFDLIDPVANAEFYKQVEYWTIEQRNTDFIQLNSSLVINRILVVLGFIFTAIVSYSYYQLRIFNERNHYTKTPFRKNAPNNVSNTNKLNITSVTPITYSTIKPIQRYSLSAFISLVKTEYLTTVLTKTFVFILITWAILICTEVLSGLQYLESLGVTPLPTTSTVINRYSYDVLPHFTAIFLVLFASEMSWRDKEQNISDLIDITPISNLQRFMSKWLALVFIPITFISVAIVISSFLQLAFGGTLDFLLYSSLYIYVGIPLLCIATLLLFINAVSPNKVLAIVISLVIVILSQSDVGGYIGLEHGMFKFGHYPQLQHSEFIGFSATSDAFWGYMSLWGSMSVIFALLSFKLMQRGRDVFIPSKIQPQFKLSIYSMLLSLFVIFSVFSAALVFYQTNVVGNYQSNDEYNNWKADYERKFQDFRNMPLPTVIAVNTNMDLYPNKRRYELTATFTLENKTQNDITELLISTHSDVTYSNINLHNATLTQHDKVFHQYIFKFDTPLKPAQQSKLTFTAKRTHNGYKGVISDSAFTPKFIYFRDIRFMPVLGFNEYYVIQSDRLRREHGLLPLPEELTLEQDIDKHQGDFSEQIKWATIETVVTTAENHIAVAPGELINHSSNAGRNTYHYKTMHAIRHIQPIISAEFERSQRQVEGTTIEVYHTKQHAQIAQEHLDSIEDTLKYGNQHFGQYPAKQLRLFEMPNVFGMSGYAMPQMMLIDEVLGFNVDRNNQTSFDHLYRRTAHETAHQWWGHGLDSAITEGGSMMVETLAVYTQAQLLTQKYGPEYLHRLLRYANDRYFFGRGQSSETEKPLYRADENHLIYSKGTVAMNALVKQLGAKTVNAALKHLMDNFHYPQKPATSIDFINALNELTQYKQQPFINYWLKQVHINDWRVETAEAKKLTDGNYLVSVCISNQLDQETSEFSDEITVELAIFSEHPETFYDKPKDARTILNRKLILNKPQNCFEYQTNTKPKFVVVDPYYQGLDQNRDNNLKLINIEINKGKDDK